LRRWSSCLTHRKSLDAAIIFHLHFTPTGQFSGSTVERFFARITTEAIRRRSLSSVRQLIRHAYLAEHKKPKPFICAQHSIYILLSMSYISLIAENSELHNSSHDITERHGETTILFDDLRLK
jgi:hypothetical protein